MIFFLHLTTWQRSIVQYVQWENVNAKVDKVNKFCTPYEFMKEKKVIYNSIWLGLHCPQPTSKNNNEYQHKIVR
jgi:hypothetical protein